MTSRVKEQAEISLHLPKRPPVAGLNTHIKP